MKQLSEKAQAFLNRKPTKIASVAGCTFYEHPYLGDEAPLYVITKKGRIYESPFFETPDADDVLSLYS